MTSDSAFKGLYCTELRSPRDNAQHPIAIQAFFTTLSNVPFFPYALSLMANSEDNGKAPSTIYGHHICTWQSLFFLVCQLPVKRMNPGMDFPTITVIQTYFVFNFLLLLLEGWYVALEKLTYYFHACVTKQRLNADLTMSHCSQHMHDGVYNLLQNRDKWWDWNYYPLSYCRALTIL